MGLAVVLVVGRLMQSSLDPNCIAIRSEHDRRMKTSDETLLRLSSLGPKEKCLFYRERDMLLTEALKPGQRCIPAGNASERFRLESEARLYNGMAQSCSA